MKTMTDLQKYTKRELFEECYPLAMTHVIADGRLNASHGVDVMQGVIAIRMVKGWDTKEDLFAAVQQVEPDETILPENPFA